MGQGGRRFPHLQAELGLVRREEFPPQASSPNLLLTHRRARCEFGKHSWKLQQRCKTHDVLTLVAKPLSHRDFSLSKDKENQGS